MPIPVNPLSRVRSVNVERNLSKAANDELECMLASRHSSLHAELRHFYSMGYTQALVEWQQKTIRKLNEDRSK